ncbi:BglG family transcription antiterminator [Priestia megaterium]|uniref:PRD domain-containing protein n=2 Tax=Priestia megaterium TaxID=1404 RepID=A0A6M6DVU1_PRIMG|nr:BglG family transcription antiterminator [Priestia megaterium]AJI25461.1 PTS system, Lactose/Cellobiose specific IIB subunit [Priestia megaterium NBRC 15308 = ATCC 14581]KFM97051.1 PTS system, Lactose/Cellobiose specific IIB subunit [Priestia megaterium]KGJ76070.1 PTS sugar transporter [Priestia megaterium NBRC 15308 = ATCC 14581]KLV31925.1 PTS sugar transporter [Priestia megaterium]MBU8752229.1 BglG family transcription antiterminator [Priestia megaterium]
MLDKRSTAVLQVLLQAATFISVQELMKQFQVSRRTIYYDIEKINDWLCQQELEFVQYTYGKGFFLNDQVKDQVAKQISHVMPSAYLSVEDRQIYVALMCILRGGKIGTQQLMDETEVSRNTVLQDIKDLKNKWVKKGISLTYSYKDGYEVKGSESDIRNLLYIHITELLSQHQEELLKRVMKADYEYSMIYHWLVECEDKLGMAFTDKMLTQLAYMLTCCIQRIGGKRYVDALITRKDELEKTRQYKALQEIESVLGFDFPPHEKHYLATVLLSAKVNVVNQADSDDWMRSIVKEMVSRFQAYACVVFEDRNRLEQNLYIHLKTAYYRLLYNIHLPNPMLSAIQTKYQDIVELTKKALLPLENSLQTRINEDEISYFALHFGGWMKKQEGRQKQKRIVIVCANGIGTSRMLQYQLEQLLTDAELIGPMTVRDYEQFKETYDLVITTTPLKKRMNVMLVNPILTDDEKQRLIDLVEPASSQLTTQAIMGIIKQHANIQDEPALLANLKLVIQQSKKMVREDKKPMLHEVLQEPFLQLTDSADDWKSAVRLAAKPLLNYEYIEPSYVEAMIKSVEQLGPYIVIAPKVALPHARPEHGVNRVGMSMLRLKEPVYFSTEKQHGAQLIIVLAATDNETHLKALSQLSMMLSENDNIDKLIAMNTKQEMLALIEAYSN